MYAGAHLPFMQGRRSRTLAGAAGDPARDRETTNRAGSRNAATVTLSRRAFGAFMAAVLCAFVFGGVSLATSLQQQAVNQSANSYGVTTSSVANFPTAPTVYIGSPWNWTSTCNTSYNGQAGTGAKFSNGNWLYEVVGLNGSAAKCSAHDFAEVWQFAGSTSTMKGEVDTWDFYASWTGGNAQSYSAAISYAVDITAGNNNGAGIVFALDYGEASPPSVIGSLSVVVT